MYCIKSIKTEALSRYYESENHAYGKFLIYWEINKDLVANVK